MKARGFTLVELMVALTGGLAFTVFVFMMSRDVSRFFQEEVRSADATLSAVTGFQRLRADIARAGFLASPNLAKDPSRCPPPIGGAPLNGLGSGWTPLMQQMALARIDADFGAGGGSDATELTNNGLSPDRLILYGNYTGEDQFSTRTVSAGQVILSPTTRGLIAAGYDPVGGAANQAILDRLFPAGRLLRIVDETGREQYALIASTTAATATQPTISLAANPALIFKSPGTVCGLRGFSAQAVVNPVNIVQYDLRNLSADPNFSFVYVGEPPFNANRLELVRSELLPDGTVAPNSTELVAEYAVNFKLGLTVWDKTTNNTLVLPAGDPLIPEFAGDPTVSPALNPNRGPHLIRAIHPELSVRTRAPDRTGNIEGRPLGDFRVALDGNKSTHARVRTLQADVATRNHRNRTW